MQTDSLKGVSLRIVVSDETYNALDQTAKAQGKDIESACTDLLAKFSTVSSVKPIIVSDAARQQIEKLVGRNIGSEDQLLYIVKHALNVKLNDVDIPLTPYLIDRLRSRCIGMDFAEFMKRTVKRLLEEFANIR
jgi:hypothetical protein